MKIPWGGSVALMVTGVVFIPLLGLLFGLLNPIQNPLLGETPTLLSVLQQANILKLIVTTFALSLIVSICALSLGTWLAWVDQRAKYRGAKLLNMLSILPLAIPSYVIASTLRSALSPHAGLGKMLGLSAFTGFFPAVIVLIIITTPYVHLLVSAALSRLSTTEEEAAQCFGCSSWRVFIKITLPRLRPSLAFSWLITQLYIVSDFGTVAVLDCPVLTWRLFQAIQHLEFTKATAMGLALLCLTIPILICGRWIHSHVVLVSTAAVRVPVRKPLSNLLKIATYLLHVLIIGLGVVLPTFMLIDWIMTGLANHTPFASVWMPIKDTLVVVSLSALLIMMLAYVPAWFVAMHRRSKIATWIEQGIYLNSALPGTLLAFGLLLAALLLSRSMLNSSMYQILLGSGILLFLGYFMRFVTHAYAGLKSALLLFDSRLIESAKILGARRSTRFRRIILPLLAPGTAASFILVWLAVMKELPITLLLGNAMGIQPLSVRMYDRYQEAFLQDAGLAGLILLLLSFGVMLISSRWRRYV